LTHQSFPIKVFPIIRIGNWILCEDAILPVLPGMAVQLEHNTNKFTKNTTLVLYKDGRVLRTKTPLIAIFNEITAGIAIKLTLRADKPTEITDTTETI